MNTLLKVEGEVVESLVGIEFMVRLEDGDELRVYLSGKMRHNKIRVIPGDMVIIEMSSNMKAKDQVGRIIRRK